MMIILRNMLKISKIILLKKLCLLIQLINIWRNFLKLIRFIVFCLVSIVRLILKNILGKLISLYFWGRKIKVVYLFLEEKCTFSPHRPLF